MRWRRIGVVPRGDQVRRTDGISEMADSSKKTHATQTVDRLRDHADDRTQRSERRDHQEATGRSHHRAERDDRQGQRGDRQQATGRHPRDHHTGRSDRGRPPDREGDHERAM
jgi:hypothetical protein